MKKIILIILALVVFCFGYNYLVNSPEKKFTRRLTNLIALGEKEIPLKYLTDFYWDKVCIFPPYTDEESLEKTISENIKVKYKYVDDSEVLIIFLNKKDNVSTTWVINRSYKDIFDAEGAPRCLSKNDAVYKEK